MNIFIVYAHPEPRSLNGSLKNVAVDFLKSSGDQVRISDLYAMNWKAAANGQDFTHYNSDQRLFYMQASTQGFHESTQTENIEAEQEKLLWADAVISQFPFWWFHIPAILKEWVDRVFAGGFAYGVGQYEWDIVGDAPIGQSVPRAGAFNYGLNRVIKISFLIYIHIMSSLAPFSESSAKPLLGPYSHFLK